MGPQRKNTLVNTVLCPQEKNLSVNTNKCLFVDTEFDYYGFHISALGISPDKDCVQDFKEMQPPSTATEARNSLGLINTVAHFVPNLATMTEPIHPLTHRDTP